MRGNIYNDRGHGINVYESSDCVQDGEQQQGTKRNDWNQLVTEASKSIVNYGSHSYSLSHSSKSITATCLWIIL